MINTLYLPELREMLAEGNRTELAEFCAALHPARTAEFMEGLLPGEAWRVLQFAEASTRTQIFSFFEPAKQVAIIEGEPRQEIAHFIAELPADDRVALLREVTHSIVEELLPLVESEERRDIIRLRSFPEGTAGAMMTTDFAKLSENLTVREALDELSHQAEHLETIYYIYLVDEQDHLDGVVSTRKLVSAFGKPNMRLADLMNTNLVTVHVMDDQEAVAHVVAKYDLLAIPVVSDDRRILGIITHDDVMDVVRDEATEDAQRIAAVSPLDDSYMQTDVLTMSWKRGMWLAILFVTGSLTAFALARYDEHLQQKEWKWLVLFIPLIISTGGNSGSQSATLVITAMSTGDVKVTDWWRIAGRELLCGIVLGVCLGVMGYIGALFQAPSFFEAVIVPLTVLLVVTMGTFVGSMLPLFFKLMNLDPALMSNPFVSAISDVLGIIIYMNVALLLMRQATGT